MIRNIRNAFAISLLAGAMLLAIPLAWAQEPAEKTPAEKTTTEKNQTAKPQPEKTPAQKPATESPGRPRDLEPGINKTFYLSNVSGPTDLQDVVNALRTIVSIQRVQQIPSLGAIVMRGTAEQVDLAQKLIDDIDKPKKKFGGEYRLDFRIRELESEKRLNSRTYTLLIEPHELAKLRLGTRVPLSANNDPDKKQLQFIDVGQNIDCQVRTETESAVGVNIDVDFSNFGMSEQLTGEGRGYPVLQQFRVTVKTTLELGKPIIIDSFDDPSSKRTFQIEVVATRVKQKE
jgi:hypothetical protein